MPCGTGRQPIPYARRNDSGIPTLTSNRVMPSASPNGVPRRLGGRLLSGCSASPVESFLARPDDPFHKPFIGPSGQPGVGQRALVIRAKTEMAGDGFGGHRLLPGGRKISPQLGVKALAVLHRRMWPATPSGYVGWRVGGNASGATTSHGAGVPCHDYLLVGVGPAGWLVTGGPVRSGAQWVLGMDDAGSREVLWSLVWSWVGLSVGGGGEVADGGVDGGGDGSDGLVVLVGDVL